MSHGSGVWGPSQGILGLVDCVVVIDFEGGEGKRIWSIYKVVGGISFSLPEFKLSTFLRL